MAKGDSMLLISPTVEVGYSKTISHYHLRKFEWKIHVRYNDITNIYLNNTVHVFLHKYENPLFKS